MTEFYRARNTDPVTSFQAAESSQEMAKRHFAVITNCLKRTGPLGKDGIASHTGLDGVAVARRLPELLRQGLVALTGRVVPSSSGRSEREWTLAS